MAAKSGHQFKYLFYWHRKSESKLYIIMRKLLSSARTGVTAGLRGDNWQLVHFKLDHMRKRTATAYNKSVIRSTVTG